jgi:hypothetical protein
MEQPVLPSIQDIFDAVDSQWSHSPDSVPDRYSDTPYELQLLRPHLAPSKFWKESPEATLSTFTLGPHGAHGHIHVKGNTNIAKGSYKIGAERAKDLSACPKLSREASIALKQWFRQHLTDPMGPYPNRATKEKLAAEMNCSRQQVENWFLNARRRWKHSQN